MKRKFAWIILAIILVVTGLSPGALAQPFQSGSLEGYITRMGEYWIEIEGYSGDMRLLFLDENTLYYIDDTPAEFRDFKIGMEIFVAYQDFYARRLEGYSTENPGYISPGSKVRSGMVKTIDRNQIVVKVTGGGEESYFLAPSTIVIKQGKLVPLSTLYVGDRVRLFFDEVDTPFVSRVHIQGYSEKIKSLYRGVLDAAEGTGNVITLKDVEIFSHGKWRPYRDLLKVEYSMDNDIYLAGSKIAPQHLKYLRGKTVYAAVTDFFGRDRIEKLVIKNQYEALYSEKIERIHWYGDTFELGNRRNMDFDEGTIIIKGERLVDRDSLAPGADAYIIADGRGSSAKANVVYIYSDDMNNSPLGQNYLYAGQLDMVVENLLTLEDFYLLNRNEWESFRDTKELYYDDDTFIYDGVERRRISPEEFYSGEYAIEEGSRSHRRGRSSWFSYAFTDGDRVVAISLMDELDSLLRQRITLGIVDRVEEDPHMGKTLYLREARDWSSRNEAWMPKSIPVRVRLENALAVRNNAPLDLEDLRPGDTVYCVREDYEGKFILVK